jgi:3-mercaptopyruvate sulfurtransferase SseA
MAASTPSSIVINQTEFDALAEQSGVKVLDIRTEAEYNKGHIPGAINVPWQKLNVSERDGVRNEYEDDVKIEAALREAGLSYDDTILIYAASSMVGRVYTVLDYAGFEKLHVLDAGVVQWKGKLTKAPSKIKPSDFKLTRKKENRVEQDFVAGNIGSENTVIIDGRGLETAKDGHIPSAQIVPVQSFLEDKTFKLRNREELLAELASKGVTPDKTIISYCGSGAAASSSYLYLKDLGFNDVRFYDKSWDEWSRTDKGQTMALPNFAFSGDALNGESSLGPRFMNQDEVKSAQAKGAVVVDVRPAGDYNIGRIPDSVHVFWRDTVDAEGKLKGAKELKALYAKQGITPDKQVIVFARGGLQLSQTYLVLKLLGYDNVQAFEGKWDGWVNPAYASVKKS